jgi:PA14 domain
MCHRRISGRGFPELATALNGFAIDYTGKFWIQNPGLYRFRLTSDDGAILYVDDQLITDNDGIHSPERRRASIIMAAVSMEFECSISRDLAIRLLSFLKSPVPVRSCGFSARTSLSLRPIRKRGNSPFRPGRTSEYAAQSTRRLSEPRLHPRRLARRSVGYAFRYLLNHPSVRCQASFAAASS